MAAVEMLRLDAHGRLHVLGLNDTAAPEGSPAALKETDWLVPDNKFADTEVVTELPWLTLSAPLLVSAKSKALGVVPEAGGNLIT